MDGKRRATRKSNAVVFSSKEPATFNNIGAIAGLSSTRPWLGNSSTDRIGYWTTMVHTHVTDASRANRSTHDSSCRLSTSSKVPVSAESMSRTATTSPR